jgi:uncharacterized membrane protein
MPTSQDIRHRLPHPVIDGDGHGIENTVGRFLGMFLLLMVAATPRTPGLASAASTDTLPTAFTCLGNEPFWKLEIRQGMASYSSLAADAHPQPMELRGSFRSLASLAEPVLVWRGRGGDTPRDMVAFIIESTARCRDTMSDREGQTEFQYSARLSLGDGELVAGCCRAETASDDPDGPTATEHFPVADLASKPPDDWSRLLMDLLPGIKACLSRTPGTITRVTKAWPMNKAMTGVRTRDDEGGHWECIAQVEGEAVHLFEPVADGDTPPGEGRVIFTPAAMPPPVGECYAHERVLYPDGPLLGWLSLNTC